LAATIWVDFDNLPGHGQLASHVRQALAETKIFISVTSPSWVESVECRKEFDIFINREHVGEPKLVKLSKLPIEDYQSLPEALDSARGYEFHNGAKGRAMELKGELREEAIGNFAYELRDLILQARRGPRATVLLLASPDRAKERETGLLELRRLGFEVLPSGRRRESIEELAERVDFAVLLFGQESTEELATAYEKLKVRWASAPPTRCLSSVPGSATEAALDRLLQEVRLSDHLACDHVGYEDWLGAARERLDELLNAARKPTIYLRYSEAQMEVATQVRTRIPPDFEVIGANLSGGTNLAALESRASETAHGVLVINKDPDLLTRTLNELKKFVHALVGVYLDANDPAAVAATPTYILDDSRWLFVAGDGQPGIQVPAVDPLRSLTLGQFLARVERKARQ
jgi:hypothetical protein